MDKEKIYLYKGVH